METTLGPIATGLGVGILLDATIVRALLLPAVVSLLGDWNSWIPRSLVRVMRVPAPGPLHPRRAVAEGAGS